MGCNANSKRQNEYDKINDKPIKLIKFETKNFKNTDAKDNQKLEDDKK